MGIGGIGVSGLAMLLAAEGNRVSGCDIAVSPAIAHWLAGSGIAFSKEHSKAHLRGVDRVIASPAVPSSNAELAEAKRRGIPISSRGEALADYCARRRTVAVCGTHGKTTTSCFAAMLLDGLTSGVGWCIGGWTNTLGCVARPPSDGANFVVEADESDGTLSLYKPFVTVVTSIDRDHLENFGGSFDALQECFAAVCEATSETVVYCADDFACRAAAAHAHCKTIGYGFGAGADIRAEFLGGDASGQRFNLHFGGMALKNLLLPLPGRHNLMNALGAIGAAIACGIPAASAAGRIESLCDLPHRRYERLESAAGFDIVSDYSHHPAEIRALLDMAKGSGKPLFAIFQPHRYSRTRDLVDDFAAAFSPLSGGSAFPDRLVLLPVYSAFEQDAQGGTSASLYARLREANEAGALDVVPELAASGDEVFDYLVSRREILHNYRVLMIGAGSIGALADRLARCGGTGDAGKVALRTSCGVSAFADSISDIDSEEALAALLHESSARCGDGQAALIRVLGQGSNIVPPPLGVRGILVRLRNDTLEVAEDRRGCPVVSVGCGMPGAKLLEELARRGLSGLEFMVGIPGTVGGWLAMNAGTRHGEIGSRVASVVAYSLDGARIEASRSRCRFSYRSCPFLASRIAFSVKLRLTRDDPCEIRSMMRRFAEMRFDFSGLRTSGSVFKNPPGISAGELADRAGCKGMRVGGAFVSDRHANIIAAGRGATSSDILALTELVQERVKQNLGITLERETRTW